MKKITKLACSLVMLCSVFNPGNAQAVTLFTDNFNSENGGIGATNYNALSNWTVSDGTVDLIGNGFFDFQPGYGLYLDMDGSTAEAGQITTILAFSLNTGVDYTLQFDLAGNQRGAGDDSVGVMVGLGSIYSGLLTLPADQNFTTFSFNFSVPVATMASISFYGVGNDNVGLLLDNIELTARDSQVPEPASMALMGLSLAGVRALRRKKS